MDKLIQFASEMLGIPAAQLQGQSEADIRAMLSGADTGMTRAEAATIPATANEADMTVDVVVATESPVRMPDWDRMEMVDEVLLMSGLRLADIRKGKLPLLDTHSRSTVKNILGSTENLRIEGDKLIGTRRYSAIAAAEFKKTIEGHLDQASVGYRVFAATYIEIGETANVGGKSFTAVARTMRIATDWIAIEDSACPIGADPTSGTRAFSESNITTKNQQQERQNMENAPAPATPATPAAVTVDTDGIRAEGIKVERERQNAIRALCTRANCTDKAQRLIDEGRSVAEAQEQVLEVAIGRANTNTVGVTVTASESDKVRAAFTDALLIRSGAEVKTPHAGADEVRGFTLLEMGREVLRRNGISAVGSKQEVAQRALSTADFANILANVANKSLATGFGVGEETYDMWTDSGTVNDFRENTIARVSETDDLLEVKEGDTYKYSSRVDGKETFRVYKYGRMLQVTWETLVNDDLNALTDTPARFGQSCKRLEGDVVYAVLTANAAMGDGDALFHTNHANISAAAAVISDTTLAAGILSMKKQKDDLGKQYLNIRPRFVIGPVEIEGAAEIFFNSINLSAALQQNPYAGNYFTRVYDARLSADSTTTWYLAGAKGQTVRLFRMAGQTTPYIETNQSFEADGLTVKVRHVVGAKALSWKALYRNEAP